MHLGGCRPSPLFDRFRMKTKGEIEAEISRAMVQFEIDYMGRGPKEATTHIVADMVSGPAQRGPNSCRAAAHSNR